MATEGKGILAIGNPVDVTVVRTGSFFHSKKFLADKYKPRKVRRKIANIQRRLAIFD